MLKQYVSSTSETQFIEVNGRKLAYRSVGNGRPMVLAVRFRGTMDSWDPAFLDALVEQDFRVVVFDYSGLGQSSGTPTYHPASLATDIIDLIGALQLDRPILGGWSIGGIAAQFVLAKAPQLVSHVVLLATTPPGDLPKTGDRLFYELAKRPNDFEDFLALFFEPTNAGSREAAERSAGRLALRTHGRSPEVPYEWAGNQLSEGPQNPVFPADPFLAVLRSTPIPVMHLGGDHDIVFPVENWHALSRQLPGLHLVTLPSTGHGPHMQYPHAAARHIAAFVTSDDNA
ncbi:Pimeloyl-ACP methyl ester carboxylesterase [Dyella jiangningensis]|uniref:alpha/beta fold hydrolase n=1 Tax=Dyella sp. AtDHG13 TaxID=1938897 RepID=UPI000885B49C|nr:alpha/beta hydrolase [Dyella sp. AtDHG13]PXV56882.1 pimeloyl-ACP methyl ester carboxylesterase [Dyella sp. AtDHG13]SDK59519.1 Pimeloyl-ACP methyl ester carboxylesterase [Dyella jiangningensis]